MSSEKPRIGIGGRWIQDRRQSIWREHKWKPSLRDGHTASSVVTRPSEPRSALRPRYQHEIPSNSSIAGIQYSTLAPARDQKSEAHLLNTVQSRRVRSAYAEVKDIREASREIPGGSESSSTLPRIPIGPLHVRSRSGRLAFFFPVFTEICGIVAPLRRISSELTAVAPVTDGCCTTSPTGVRNASGFTTTAKAGLRRLGGRRDSPDQSFLSLGRELKRCGVLPHDLSDKPQQIPPQLRVGQNQIELSIDSPPFTPKTQRCKPSCRGGEVARRAHAPEVAVTADDLELRILLDSVRLDFLASMFHIPGCAAEIRWGGIHFPQATSFGAPPNLVAAFEDSPLNTTVLHQIAGHVEQHEPGFSAPGTRHTTAGVWTKRGGPFVYTKAPPAVGATASSLDRRQMANLVVSNLSLLDLSRNLSKRIFIGRQYKGAANVGYCAGSAATHSDHTVSVGRVDVSAYRKDSQGLYVSKQCLQFNHVSRDVFPASPADRPFYGFPGAIMGDFFSCYMLKTDEANIRYGWLREGWGYHLIGGRCAGPSRLGISITGSQVWDHDSVILYGFAVIDSEVPGLTFSQCFYFFWHERDDHNSRRPEPGTTAELTIRCGNLTFKVQTGGSSQGSVRATLESHGIWTSLPKLIYCGTPIQMRRGGNSQFVGN
ncbi:hypothetical protein GLOTRDRAFT_95744 [Gloeophyllum trabeum ATCC 11539]|uniref:Uncharacterized protein n=1 Tax=Gloeophyllum trabeum (strain ATCC 11539 / FP-39264 / Madison 617) TaxID=670483 RepID=S7RCZ0_GLOTA|nr:uncharacterized protein GLOTRDRAFT_95744 [Gloeophyllum trabeum ATCC 11539]EPQ52065.1 hypothetical protein GLOTRDRAFT_95744 [Gloeophyllum trabeum ATCC 11539]